MDTPTASFIINLGVPMNNSSMVQDPKAKKKLFDAKHRMLLEKGGFTEEDILRMESSL